MGISPSVSWPPPLGNSGKQAEMRLTVLTFQGKVVFIVTVIMGAGDSLQESALAFHLYVDSRN